jgi:hypothetical protein
MSADVENTAANGAPGYDSSGVAGVPPTSTPASKTILVIGLGMVGIGEHGLLATHCAAIYLIPVKRLSRRFLT